MGADAASGEFASVSRDAGYFEVRFERILNHEQSTVWDMLTTPARLAEWLAPGEIELREGGRVALHFADSGTVIDSAVSVCDAPGVVGYSWSAPGELERPLRWETFAEGTATRILLTARIPEAEDVTKTCAGWEAHLAMLQAALEGSPIEFPFERFQAAREAYRQRV